jgi:myo-inositol 2-dehydrogenase / D-chiro-inositol 1-dehydrogenase
MPDIRVGIIGAGWIAQTHVEALALLEGATVAAVADLDAERAERAADKTGAMAYRDWRALLEEVPLDAVLVCTPPQHHLEPAAAALERGVPVYLEKPIARTLSDAREIVEAIKRTDGLCGIGYQWHSIASLDQIREELRQQQIGLLIGRSLGPTMSRPWLARRAEGGGQLLERASHHIDLQRMIAGEVEAVHARAGSATLADRDGADSDIEDVISLELSFAGGATGAIHVAWLRSGIRGIYDLTIAASEALMTLRLDPDFSLTGSSRGQAIERREEQPPSVQALSQFLDAVRAGDRDAPFCHAEDAAATLAVALACEQSLESGQAVKVDPAGLADGTAVASGSDAAPGGDQESSSDRLAST